MVALSHCFGHVGQRCKALHDPRRQQRRGQRGAMSGAMSGPLSEIDIHKLNSGQKLNMIMCARFNLPSFTLYLFPPPSSIIFNNTFFYWFSQTTTQQSSDICDQLPRPASHNKNEEIFLENYATECDCVCVCVRASAVFLVKTTLCSKLETKIVKKGQAAAAWVSQTDTRFYDTRTSGGCNL